MNIFYKTIIITPDISWAKYSNAGYFFYPDLTIGGPHKIYGNRSKVYRVHTFADLYYSSITEQGNENLQPENAIS
ncbi:hypothetical protein [Chryseobacterium sp.]|uniref:hypothetical protein n=1 Tax=Chryseobacterium sp. TaxID=1871047 RepID=UPI00388D03B7